MKCLQLFHLLISLELSLLSNLVVPDKKRELILVEKIARIICKCLSPFFSSIINFKTEKSKLS
ncbi:hypothetical protein HanRHA438_Chr08g0334321 [Helianthus annuus]|nr:hypothetical protein HanRHA438_Chr08g0334321 [Helianthus annuus]